MLLPGVQAALRFLVGNRLCFTAGISLTRKFGGPSDRVVLVKTTALDPSHILPMETAIERVKREPREVLFVGVVWEMKGVHILLDAVRQLFDRGLNVRLRIIGAANDGGAWLDQRISALGLESSVVHDPHMAWDRLIEEYERSDVFVMPSLEGRGESGPKVVLEAMARGVPVVASNVGSVPTIVAHHENGWIVSPGSAGEIADAVDRLWNDVGLRERFAANGIRTASQYELDGVIDEMVEKVRELKSFVRV